MKASVSPCILQVLIQRVMAPSRDKLLIQWQIGQAWSAYFTSFSKLASLNNSHMHTFESVFKSNQMQWEDLKIQPYTVYCFAVYKMLECTWKHITRLCKKTFSFRLTRWHTLTHIEVHTLIWSLDAKYCAPIYMNVLMIFYAIAVDNSQILCSLTLRNFIELSLNYLPLQLFPTSLSGILFP